MNELIREDGFINATAICKAGNKKFNDWYRLTSTKKLIDLCEKYLDIPKYQVIDIKKGGGNDKRGSWIHPTLATNLAAWISSEFSFKVSLWIEEWKIINNNINIYNNELYNITPDYNNQIERQIQLKLYNKLGGEMEVETDSGFIDLLTDTEIIEIKDGKNWKDAVGQILIYSIDYPIHTKRIHLFNVENNQIINNKCAIYNIVVSYE